MTALLTIVVLVGVGVLFSAGFGTGWASRNRKLARDQTDLEKLRTAYLAGVTSHKPRGIEPPSFIEKSWDGGINDVK